MGYEINVSLNGKHFFATHERSITNNWKLKEILTGVKPEVDYFSKQVITLKQGGLNNDQSN